MTISATLHAFITVFFLNLLLLSTVSSNYYLTLINLLKFKGYFKTSQTTIFNDTSKKRSKVEIAHDNFVSHSIMNRVVHSND